jgi:hypothetical protein
LINGCFHPLCRNFLSNFYQTFLFDTKGHFGIKVHQTSDTVAWIPEMEQLDTRRILKRLAKENLKQLGRMVAKIAHANPMTVLRTIVHQIEAYKDMIAPVVDAFKYLTQVRCCVCLRWPFYFNL